VTNKLSVQSPETYQSPRHQKKNGQRKNYPFLKSKKTKISQFITAGKLKRTHPAKEAHGGTLFYFGCHHHHDIQIVSAPQHQAHCHARLWQYTHRTRGGGKKEKKHVGQFNSIVHKHTAYFVIITGPSYWISKGDIAGRAPASS
jgi:hypothetical protein